MRSFEGEVRALVVIKLRRFPAFHVVATRAFWIRATLRELPAVRILMASVTSLGRGAEYHILHRHFQVRRLVTAHAGHRAMRPQQRKGRGGVIESERLRPGNRRVARFATLRFPLRSRLLHARRELVVMRIRMTFLASEIRKVIGDR